MAFRIRNNYEADVALTNLYANRTKLSQLEQQLSTGLRIVRAADDATDLFVADYLKQTYVGLQRGTMNAQYGLTAARIVDDALGKIYDILVKIKDKAVEAANARTQDERIQAQQQINEYVRNIAQLVHQAEYDGKRILEGDVYHVHFGSHKNETLVINGSALTAAAGLKIVASANAQANGAAHVYFKVGDAAASKIFGYDGITNQAYELTLNQNAFTLDVTNVTGAEATIETVENLMKAIDKIRGYYAGIENKLQNIIENNQMLVDNLKEGESVVRNVDYASAFAEYQKMQVIMQANVAALAQANQVPQLVMQLMR